MDEIIDALRELFQKDDGGPIGQTLSKALRILQGGVEGSVGRGVGPIILTVRALDYVLDQAGVPADNAVRVQLRRELDDVDQHGAHGMRILDDGPTVITPPDFRRIIDHGPIPPADQIATFGVVDP